MSTASPGNDNRVAPPSDAAQQAGDRSAGLPESGTARQQPPLTQLQQDVLEALSDSRQISFSVLRSRVHAPAEELHSALDGLRALGLISRLNTVVESYAPRFPGLRVDD